MKEMREKSPKVAEIPFNSTNKYQVLADEGRRMIGGEGEQRWGRGEGRGIFWGNRSFVFRLSSEQ